MFAMIRARQCLGQHVGGIVSTSEPLDGNFLVDVVLNEEVLGLDVAILVHDGLVISSELNCLVIDVDGGQAALGELHLLK